MCDGLWIECRGKAAEIGRVGRTPKSKAGRGEVVKRLGRAEKVAGMVIVSCWRQRAVDAENDEGARAAHWL